MTEELKQKILAYKNRKVSKTVTAELMGYSYTHFIALLERLNIEWPNYNKAIRVTYQGFTGTFREHGLRMNLNSGTLKFRWKRYGTLDTPKPRTMSVIDIARFVIYRKQGLAAQEAAALVGYHYNWLHKRASALFGKKYKTIVRNAPRKRRTKAELAAAQSNKSQKP